MAAGPPPSFSMTVRLSDISFDGGALTATAYLRAPGGNYGKVFRGIYKGTRVAVKILASKAGVEADAADAAFMRECANIVAVRFAVERARTRGVGEPLAEHCNLPNEAARCSAMHDLRGHKHVVLIYGVGTETDLDDVAPGLPRGRAHLIVMEELTGDTLEVLHLDTGTLPRVATEMACGLALLAAAHVVHADLKVREKRVSERECESATLSACATAEQRHASLPGRRDCADGFRCRSYC